METISSSQNARLKAAARLRARRERERQALTLIDGARETARALAGGAVVREAFVSEACCQDADCRAVVEQLRQAGVRLTELATKAFTRLAYGDRLDGLIAVAETPPATLDELALPAEPLIGVIEGVEKPGNLGAILRTADAAALDALIVADSGTDLFNPNVIRASIATVFSVPIAAASSDQVLDWLRQRRVSIVAARLDASREYTDVDYSGAVAIALGSEARGLSEAWEELAPASVRVPMLGVADSLNVSATAAILFYEARRQRRALAPGSR